MLQGVTSAASMAKRWTFRYFWLKVSEAIEATSAQVDALYVKGSAVPDMSKLDKLTEEFLQVYKRRCTEVIRLVGPSMSPGLNRKALSNPGESELLVLRKLRAPSASNLRIGDVVAFANPVSVAEDNLMVRRVRGLPGTVLASEDDEEKDLVLQPGLCWVMADNPDLEPPHVEDSRSFGPVPFQNIEGRILYAIRTPTDHEAINNSAESSSDDAPIVDVEVSDLLQDPELFDTRPAADPNEDAARKDT